MHKVDVKIADKYGRHPINNTAPKCEIFVGWKDISKKNYRTVWLELCSPTKSNCGGGYPIKNEGRFWFVPDPSFYGKDGYVKVYTQDKKHIGISKRFYVNGMLPPCE